jgi:hypothetical protein
LHPFAREYVGWSEQVSAPLCRRELPTEEAPLIINFGEFAGTTPGDLLESLLPDRGGFAV